MKSVFRDEWMSASKADALNCMLAGSAPILLEQPDPALGAVHAVYQLQGLLECFRKVPTFDSQQLIRGSARFWCNDNYPLPTTHVVHSM
jgi:hypothetical protein